MPENVMLQEAIEAIRQGKRHRALDLLTRLLRADQNNPEYWLWMSSVVETSKERIYCLQSALKLDPGNPTARRGLILLGAAPAGTDIQPVAPIRRPWEVALQENPRPGGIKGLLINPATRAISIILLAIVVFGLILAGIFGGNLRGQRAVAIIPTKTPGPPPTFTATPTMIPLNRTAVPPTATPTFTGPTPLWMLLEATFTPTPEYVATPHSVSEAYRAAQRAMERTDWAAALDFMQQAVKVEPDSADIQFHIGELYGKLGEYQQAIAAYERAIEINENFAPAYLGRARALRAINPNSDIAKDLQRAIKADANYGEAYLEYVAYLIDNGENEQALELLKTAQKLLPDAPLVYLYRGQAELQLGEDADAFTDAQMANQMDSTLLPAYLLLGETAYDAQVYTTTIRALQTYLSYLPENAQAWTVLGQAYYAMGKNNTQAIAALDQALELDKQNGSAYLYRGLAYLELDEPSDAVRDLITARRFNSRSFIASLGLSRALMAQNRLNEARGQFNASADLAETDQELAQLYYWRAQLLEAAGNPPAADQDWRALLDLPKGAAPAEWLSTAKVHLFKKVTPPARTPSAERNE